ncbi:MAG: hypothetical protein M1826_007485 [Phylliscum demangeonii]|nr:MAG: hypothetical protein M1826_007485 [Phylliscum demangeonii]
MPATKYAESDAWRVGPLRLTQLLQAFSVMTLQTLQTQFLIQAPFASPLQASPAVPSVPILASFYSFASDSTKLGEIPEYKSIGYTSAASANRHIDDVVHHETKITSTHVWGASSPLLPVTSLGGQAEQQQSSSQPRRNRGGFFRRRSVDDGAGAGIGTSV